MVKQWDTIWVWTFLKAICNSAVDGRIGPAIAFMTRICRLNGVSLFIGFAFVDAGPFIWLGKECRAVEVRRTTVARVLDWCTTLSVIMAE